MKLSVRVRPSYPQVTMEELENCIKNQVTSEVQNLVQNVFNKFKVMKIMILESKEQILNYSKEISILKESLKSALDENKVLLETVGQKESTINLLRKNVSQKESKLKILMETVGQKESTIQLLMKTNAQLQMENYDKENTWKEENEEKAVIIKELTEEISSVRREKESLEEELTYTLEELEDARSNPSPTEKSLEDPILNQKERNDSLEMNKTTINSKVRTPEVSSSSGDETDNANDSIDDLLNSDSEDEDRDRSCSVGQVKVFGKTFKGKRSAEEELYSSKRKMGRDTDLLELMDSEIHKLKTSIR